jgi:hypothetical protein
VHVTFVSPEVFCSHLPDVDLGLRHDNQKIRYSEVRVPFFQIPKACCYLIYVKKKKESAHVSGLAPLEQDACFLGVCLTYFRDSIQFSSHYTRAYFLELDPQNTSRS